MKRHLIVPLAIAGALLSALPAAAGDSGAVFTITAHIGAPAPTVSYYRPPAYIVVREPAYREPQRIIYVEPRKHGRRDHRRHDCNERVRTIERVYYEDDHRPDRRDRNGGRVVVDRRWDR